MHNLKDIRKNKDFFKKKFSERNTEINLDSILDLDKENRDLISKKEKSNISNRLWAKWITAHRNFWRSCQNFYDDKCSKPYSKN